MKAVRIGHYGDASVLHVLAVPGAVPGEHEVLRVMATGINPGETAIRSGALHDRWPATFPSGQGSDLAGIVKRVGEAVERSPALLTRRAS